jgi:hypothetical protein
MILDLLPWSDDKSKITTVGARVSSVEVDTVRLRIAQRGG